METRSVFDIIGPIVIGSSNPLTLPAVKIGKLTRELFGFEPKEISICLYDEFKRTCKNYDICTALVGGILNISASNPLILKSLLYAKEKRIKVTEYKEKINPYPPCSVKIFLCNDNNKTEVVANASWFGKVRISKINNYNLPMYGNTPTLLVMNSSPSKVLISITSVIARHKVKIERIRVSPLKEQENENVITIEMDSVPSKNLLIEINNLLFVNKALMIN